MPKAQVIFTSGFNQDIAEFHNSLDREYHSWFNKVIVKLDKKTRYLEAHPEGYKRKLNDNQYIGYRYFSIEKMTVYFKYVRSENTVYITNFNPYPES